MPDDVINGDGEPSVVTLGETLTIDDVISVARGAAVRFGEGTRARIAASRSVVRRLIP